MQRPLWASTGVKDPHYPETKYVDSLVAPHTVNTMPMPTLLACEEQLEVTGRDRRPGPERGARGAGASAGIDMADVTAKLLREGIEKFVEPFDKLIAGRGADARGDRHRSPADDRVLDPGRRWSRR